MKATNPGSRRRKIILYYTLAVVLPGIVLGFLAYRGIRNDQALREKESRRRLEMNSQDFFSEIDSSFVQFIKEQTTDSILAGKGKSDPSVLALFVSDSASSKKLITHQLLYLPVELIRTRPEQLRQTADLKEGFRLEFAEHRYSEALKYYQDKAINIRNPEERIQALVASARVNNKMNQPDQAKALYEIIRKNYPGSLLNGEIPVSLIANLEILKINQARREIDEMSINSRQYLELLLHPPCEYDENQFDLFYQSLKEIVQKTDPVTDSLFREIDVQKTRTNFLIRILTGADLITTSSNNVYSFGKSGISDVPINSSELAAVYLSWNKNNSTQTSMVIDFPIYLKSISDKLIQKLDPDSSMNVKIEDNNGQLVFSRVIAEGTSYLSFAFPENLPKEKLLLSENNPGFMATLFKAGSGIYLLIFILIVLFMLLGFVFIIYTLNTELRLNKMKSEFISNVSHELKSPLTSIRLMTEMLHHKRVETEERKSTYYSAMLEESEHLSHLIDNILDFSRIDDGRRKYDFTNLDLDELLMKFLESVRERLPEPDFEIRYNHPEHLPLIKADKSAILQVFYNLIDNAIKFSGTSRVIDVSLSREDYEIVFSVKDYGIGIPVKDQEKIFDRFYRGDEPQKSGIRGSGIGLTIVKQIVEAHGGTIGIESKVGQGSKVTVRIPLS
jgi:signal transduction histidine kinase